MTQQAILLLFVNRLKALCVVLFIATSAAFILQVMSPQPTSALSGSEFKAGNIIDEAVFFNQASMSTGQIQQFLDSKVPVCDTNGTQIINGITRAAYGAARGNPAPYTCLKDYTESVPAVINGGSDLCTQSITGGVKTAAQIIQDVSRACGINPQVLLVLIQKEQALITDDWPWTTQYDKATGYGCPDTAPCNAEYFGFFNQVHQAAKAFRRYEANPTSYNFRANRNNSVLYHPNSACGSENVFIENQATANLYIYTPYQPNQAALNNLYGTGDSCSAYGNRNFWRMFTDWFGATSNIQPYTNLDWDFEYLDGSDLGINPQPNTVGGEPQTITYNGDLYTFYYDSTEGNLLVSYADSGGWNKEVLDGAGGTNGRINATVGRNTSAAVHEDILHIFYHDTTNRDLRHGWLDHTVGTWNFEVLDGDASSPGTYTNDVGYESAVLSYRGHIQLVYYDRTYGNLRHAWYKTGTGWKFENLDGDYGAVSRYNSGSIGQSPVMVEHPSGLQLFYYDSTRGNLRHGWSTNTGWKFENLDGDAQSVSRNESNVGAYVTATRRDGGLQVFYYDSLSGNLRHAFSTNRGWKFENFDGSSSGVSRKASNTGVHPITMYFQDNLYVFYRDVSSGGIRYAWSDSSGWNFATLEGSLNTTSGLLHDTGFGPTTTEHGTSLQLFYFDNTARALRHAWAVSD